MAPDGKAVRGLTWKTGSSFGSKNLPIREIMMQSIEEQMKEISRRKKRYEDARKSRVLAAAGSGLLVSLIAVIAAAPGATAVFEQNRMTVLGSTILDARAGGYILAALISFTMGVCVTMICRQYHANRSDRKKDD